ncbi:MAG: hypothetical protein J7539_07150 [Niabella sp.]|nr:hypothetical protein [Niabella sp.]
METKDKIIEKVGWVTKMKSTPPLTQEYINSKYLQFRNMVNFLQSKNLTTRTVLAEHDTVSDESELKFGDLTEQGLEFYKKAIIPWKKKIDKSIDKVKEINNLSFLEKKYSSI